MKILASPRIYVLLTCIIPIVAVFLAYSPIYKASFIGDDEVFLVDWPLLHDLKNTPQFLAGALPPGHEGGYRPLRTVYEAFWYQMFKTRPAPYHVLAVIVHALNTLIVFGILRKIINLFPVPLLLYREPHPTHKRKQILSTYSGDDLYPLLLAGMGALLFGLHPLTVEAVAFVQASFDTVGIVFALLSYLFLLQALTGIKDNQQTLYSGLSVFVSSILALVAFGFYELTYTLPFLTLITVLLFLYQLESIRKKSIRIISIVAPFFVMLGIILCIRFVVLDIPKGGTINSVNAWFTFLAMTRAVFEYFLQTIFPLQLFFVHEIAPAITSIVGDAEFFTKLRITDGKTLLGIGAVVTVLMTAYRSRKIHPLLALGCVWFIIGLLPVLNIFPSGILYGERYTYLSLIGFVLVFLSVTSMLVFRIQDQKIKNAFLLGIVFLVLVLYGTRTFLRVADWTDSIQFWTKEANHLPEIGTIRNMRGLEYRKKGHVEDALLDFRAAIELQPYDAQPYYNASALLTSLERYKEATIPAQQAYALGPGISQYAIHYARVLSRVGEIRQAKEVLYQTLNPLNSDPSVWYLLATLAIKDNDYTVARYALEKSLEFDPSFTSGYTTLGSLYNQAGSPSATVALFKHGKADLKDKHAASAYYFTLGTAYLKLSQTEKAKEAIEEAFFLSPEDTAISSLWKKLFIASGSAVNKE